MTEFCRILRPTQPRPVLHQFPNSQPWLSSISLSLSLSLAQIIRTPLNILFIKLLKIALQQQKIYNSQTLIFHFKLRFILYYFSFIMIVICVRVVPMVATRSLLLSLSLFFFVVLLHRVPCVCHTGNCARTVDGGKSIFMSCAWL